MEESYPSAEKQPVYSTAQADWANWSSKDHEVQYGSLCQVSRNTPCDLAGHRFIRPKGLVQCESILVFAKSPGT